ncbi:MAG TPA: acetyl-CoA C-acyltransferase [Polyangiaceae bacterium]|nr:acetyl-CoA C-acyltransferase [Polyangiaceae bacterium]
MPTLRNAFLLDAVRTPIGRYRGSLASVRTDDLAAHVLSAICQRNAAVCEKLDQVVFGATNQAGEDNRDVARMALLVANLPYEVPAVTVNRLCGSGLEAVTDAVRRVVTGDADVVVAGGVESMTRAPFVFSKTDEAFSRTPPKIYDTTIGWRFENPRMQARFPLLSMGETAEEVAAKWKITREEQDAFALGSQKKAAAAVAAGAFDREIVPVTLPAKGKGAEPTVFAKDESPRADTTLEALAKLAPAFRKGGSVTAGNSSPVNDGAAAVLVVSDEVVRANGLEPLARVVASATAGVHPNLMGEGPIPAGKKALARAGWTVKDLDLVELNEAFAAQSIACVRGLELDADRVNVNGGAIALGHPIGASGARILGTLAWGLKARGAKRGMAALCIGVGQGIAMLVERGGAA